MDTIRKRRTRSVFIIHSGYAYAQDLSVLHDSYLLYHDEKTIGFINATGFLTGIEYDALAASCHPEWRIGEK